MRCYVDEASNTHIAGRRFLLSTGKAPVAKAAPKKSPATKLLAKNRRATFDYEVVEEVEAGIELTGSEVKSVRNGDVQFADSHVVFRNNQVFLQGLNISEYRFANVLNHAPTRERRLLLHRREIDRLRGRIQAAGLTLIPLDMHLAGRWIKVSLGLCRGKKQHDKRQSIKARDADRDIRRALRDGERD